MAWRVFVLDIEKQELVPRQTATLPPPPGPEDGRVVWIDLESPSQAELREIGRLYGLHPLALEDCLHDGQRPKLESYDGHVFLVIHHPRFDNAKYSAILNEVDLFLGHKFVITSHQGPLPFLDVVHERWEDSEETRSAGAAFLAYLIADTLVDDYFPVLDNLEDMLSDIDDKVFSEPENSRVLGLTAALKKQIVKLRRYVGPTRDAFVWLVRHESPLLSRNAIVHFQDVYDHLIRISDTLDLYRDLAGGVQETYLTLVANRTNTSMKKLTAFTITLMCVTLVSSIYGMNFQHMPELAWKHGYLAALGLMAGVGGLSLGVFKLRGYF
ncbi:MAG: magnesium/cobalt transporter CorA [Armatimonadetes bacterium]|uniref:Magnesium transport protein CorA n=1 Tax=Candidatus Tanganyikabacteria bacterium TaxID=2961651 RepID=A0A937X630_9BACT|nr:magnesium/cobalt transporter CorA [Candidatus Tanganyikabacteria bacterium]MBM3466157.1 magnesium/cobalt transporter CorA [Armatimonadota bacterium]